MRNSRKVFKFILPYGSETVEETVKSLPWGDDIVDISDFTPLAELVRSFQPRESTSVPEDWDYPNGEEPADDSFDPPSEYTDIADAYQALTDMERKIIDVRKRRASLAQAIEAPVAPTDNIPANSSNRVEQQQKAVEDALSRS